MSPFCDDISYIRSVLQISYLRESTFYRFPQCSLTQFNALGMNLLPKATGAVIIVPVVLSYFKKERVDEYEI